MHCHLSVAFLGKYPGWHLFTHRVLERLVVVVVTTPKPLVVVVTNFSNWKVSRYQPRSQTVHKFSLLHWLHPEGQLRQKRSFGSVLSL